MKAVAYILFFILFITANSAANSDAKLKQIIQRFGLQSVEAPKGFNEAQYRLGELLFFDPILSGSKNVSCSSCHSYKAALGDSLPLALGVGAVGEGIERKRKNKAPIISRNSPALFNVGHEDLVALFWDGRVSYDEDSEEFFTPEAGLNGEYPKYHEITRVMKSALSAQALFPMTDHKEMLGKNNDLSKKKSRKAVWDGITKRLMQHKTYRAYLQHIYPEQKINIGHIAEALAHFQKFRFASFNTPWDQYLRGDLNALSENQKRGALVFAGNGRCVVCHNGKLLGGTSFHNVVSPQIGPGFDIHKNDEGLFYTSNRDSDRYKFRTPMLRNVKYTAPYFHSGAFATIDAVIEHYVEGANGIDNYDSSWLSYFEKNNYGLKLFVETDHYRLFRKKETAHPLMRAKAIRLSEKEKYLLKDFLMNALSEKRL